MTDLIMTVVASASAIVAIIGGFLVSRVISLNSEKQGDNRELHSINKELEEQYAFEDLIDERHGDNYKVVDNIRGLIKRLESRKEEIEFSIKARPRGIYFGIVVLGYVCLFSIAIPLSWLPYSESIYNDVLTKRVLLSFFYSSLIFIFIYLFWQLKHLVSSGAFEGNSK